MIKWIGNIIMVFLLLPFTAHADMGEYAKQYFQEIESRNGAVFFSQCRNTQNFSYVATMLFEVGNKNGLLVEWKQNTVINLAKIIITPNGIELEETHGGIYTRERVYRLINELSKNKFKFLCPFRQVALKETMANETCTNSPSE